MPTFRARGGRSRAPRRSRCHTGGSSPAKSRCDLLSAEFDGVPAGGAVGHHVGARRRSGCSPRLSVARTSQRCSPGPTSTTPPLHPGVRRRHAAELGRLPVAAVERDLDLLDAGVLRPGDAGDAHRCRPRPRAPRAGTSMRDWVLTGPRARPAALGPVGREVRRTGSPRGRPPTWWPTRSRRGRARPSAPGSRARRAAARRSSPIASIALRSSVSAVERRAAGPAVLGGLQHRVGAGLHAGLGEQVRDPDTAHQALPIRSPPTSLETQYSVIQASVSSSVEQVLVAQRRSRGRPSRGSAAASPRGRWRAARARCRSGRSRRSTSATARRPSTSSVAPGGTAPR